MQVRRDSEPSLNKPSSYRHLPTPMAIDDDQPTLALLQQHSSSGSASTLVPQQQYGEVESGAGGGGGDSEAFDSLPDSTAFDSKCSLNVLRRREPLGASAGNNNKQEKKGAGGGAAAGPSGELAQHQWSVAPQLPPDGTQQLFQQQQQQQLQQQMVRPSIEIVIPNEIGPLGIHVVPSKEEGPGPLIVQGIEPGGRVDRGGRLAVGDEIVEINGYPLSSVPFNKAQEIFKVISDGFVDLVEYLICFLVVLGGPFCEGAEITSRQRHL